MPNEIGRREAEEKHREVLELVMDSASRSPRPWFLRLDARLSALGFFRVVWYVHESHTLAFPVSRS